MSTNKPTISILMSVYAEPIEWLRESVDSIRSQTFSDFEFLIVNDKPDNQESKNYLDKLSATDARVKIINNAANIGLTKSLNIALAAAEGTYIARMDADDIAMKDRLAKQLTFLQSNPDYIGCGSNVNIIDEEGKEKGSLQKPHDNAEIEATLFFESPIVHPTLFFRKNDVRYNEVYRYSQDFDFISQLSVLGKLYNIQEPLLAYRNSSKQISAAKIKDQNNFAQMIRTSNVNSYLTKKYRDVISHNGRATGSFDQAMMLDALRRNKNDRKNLSAIFYSTLFYSTSKEERNLAILLKSQMYLQLPLKHRLRFLLMPIMNFRDQNL